ncbi:MAG: BglG family transcription antiterminator [Lactovum sp.]
MHLSKRENKIVDLLLKNNLSLTANELADILKVSSKTIYRSIKRINEEVEKGELIKSEPGKGLVLNYELFLKESSGITSSYIPEPSERRLNIMLELLFKAPNKIMIDYLFEKYYLSPTVVNSDIKRMERYLNNYQVKLKKEYKKLYIEALEKDIRKAVLSIIAQKNLMDNIFTTKNHLMNSHDVDYITYILEYIEKKLETTISYPYNVNIFSHLYILLQRTRQGRILEEQEDDLEKEELELIQNNYKYFQLSEEVIKKIAGSLVKLSKNESYYLFQYLISSRVENKKSTLIRENKNSEEITIQFLEKMSEIHQVDLKTEVNIEDLLAHIQPLLYRLKNEIIIRNGVLKDILLEYSQIFYSVKKVTQQLEEDYELLNLSDDEIGFLTLYFVKYLEIAQRKKRILILCSSGIGTSELLKVKVQKCFQNIEIVDVLSSRVFLKNKEKYEDIDLILTTINLSSPVSYPTILVNAVFTKQDEERVKEILGGF